MTVIREALPEFAAGIAVLVVGTAVAALWRGPRAWMVERWHHLVPRPGVDDGDAAAIQRLSDRAAVEAAAQREIEELEELHRTGFVRVLKHTGHEPTEVIFSDGSSSFYFRSKPRYDAAMLAGRVPPGRTFWRQPPDVGTDVKVR